MALKLRRGTDSDRAGIVFAEGEPVYVTDTGELYVGDGSTAGGLKISNQLELDTTPSLGGPLDLNGNNIVGTGNIDIDGKITATGEITLGDGIEDNITVGGVLASGLVPDSDGIYDLGTSELAWRNGFFKGLGVDGEITANSLQVKSIELDDSTTVFDGETKSLFVESIVTDSVEGNLIGSVFSESSILLIDAVNNTFTGDIIDINSNIILDTNQKKITINEIELESLSLVRGNPTFLSDTTAFLSNNPLSDQPILSSVSFTDSNLGGSIALVRSRGNEESPEIIQNNDQVGTLEYSMFNGTGFESVVDMQATIDGAVAFGSIPPAKLDINISNGTNLENAVTIKSEKVNFYAVPAMPNFTTSERNNLNPEPGMIIFNTTELKFQGYQETSWVDLNI